MDCHEAELANESIEASRGCFAGGGFLAFDSGPLNFGKGKSVKFKGERRA
jgi:hypothetical protein